MKTYHLSAWQQEEYVLNQGTEQQSPQVLRHLAECAGCRSAVARLEHGVAVFRSAAVEWSSECLATHPQQRVSVPMRRLPAAAMRWAMAAMIPVVLLVLAFLPFHLTSPRVTHPAVQSSDDALLEEVDEQVSEAVPSSMESLTHLVSTQSSAGSAAAAPGSKHIAQTN
jgi:hypothetical protein